MVEDPSTPVLVLVSHHHVGIGIARSLGRLGIRVYGMDRDRFSPMFFSRYCRGLFIWDLHRAPVGDSIAFLREVSRKIGRRALLIPTSDIGAMFVEEHADQLADKYIFPERSASLVRSLCNKREMYYLARRCNVDAPETAFPRSREDVVEYLKTARFPVKFSKTPASIRRLAPNLGEHTDEVLPERAMRKQDRTKKAKIEG